MKLTTLFSLLAFLSIQSVFSAVTPPPLTQQELTIVQTVVLHKYPTPLLIWKSLKPIFPRKASVIAIINGHSHEILVDLRLRFIVSDKVYTSEEQASAIHLPHKYPPFLALINKRGLNISEVICSSAQVKSNDRRIVRLDCFLNNETTPNIWVRPITGITILVDLHLQKIVEYHSAAENTRHNPSFRPKQHNTLAVATHQPQGPGSHNNGHNVSAIVIAIVGVGSLLLLFSLVFLCSSIYRMTNNNCCHGGCCH